MQFRVCRLHKTHNKLVTRNTLANNSHQPRLAGITILAHLNGLGKTPVSLPGLAKYLPILPSFVPLSWVLFLRLDEVNARMAVVVAEFATPAVRYNLFWGFYLISHLHGHSKIVLQLHVGFTTIATFSFFIFQPCLVDVAATTTTFRNFPCHGFLSSWSIFFFECLLCVLMLAWFFAFCFLSWCLVFSHAC